MSDSTDTHRLIEEASHWLVLLRSGDASEASIQAYRTWRAADPRHETLCVQLEKNLGAFQVPVTQGIGSAVLHRALEKRNLENRSRRKLLQGALVGAGVMLGAGLVSNRVTPLAGLMADLHTATGQRRRLILDDGSELILNARSVADLEFDREKRLLRLYSGELFARVAHDARPFRVQTANGLIQTREAQLLVREHDSQSQVMTFGGALQITASAGARVQLPTGHQVAFDRNRFGQQNTAQMSETAWVDGLLELHDRPLSDAIAALRPYRAGVLRLDPRVAGLRVSGLFRLDDSDLVLDTLERALPIRILRRTGLWVSVVAA